MHLLIPGCYKDGTNGTWDYRYFAGFYLLAQILFFIAIDFSVFTECLAAGIFLFVPCRPYKKDLFNILDVFSPVHCTSESASGNGSFRSFVSSSTTALFCYIHTVKDTPSCVYNVAEVI